MFSPLLCDFYSNSSLLASYYHKYLGSKMKILRTIQAQPTQDGDGVKISRVQDFRGLSLDPFLMIDELKSDDSADFVGGFPEHPHRGIETFTYMIKGGFEHKDQLGNQKQIRSGQVQWMSTGFGVVHSEMPILDEHDGMHGFQIWLNMPAKDKLRPAKYQDSTDQQLQNLTNQPGAKLTALAGEWKFAGSSKTITSDINELASDGKIADLVLEPNANAELDLSGYEQVFIYVHSGQLINGIVKQGQLAILDSASAVVLTAGQSSAGVLIFAGNKINEKIAHYGPFVMNSMAEIDQAISDYQAGKLGKIEN